MCMCVYVCVYMCVYMCTEVRADSVVLADGQVLPCGLVVWSTGLSPQQFSREITLPKNKRGQVNDTIVLLSPVLCQ